MRKGVLCVSESSRFQFCDLVVLSEKGACILNSDVHKSSQGLYVRRVRAFLNSEVRRCKG